MNVALLHPGLMGETLAANCSATMLWASEGRSTETRARAESHGMVELQTIAELCGHAQVVISICPPSAALGLARQVKDAGFEGVYVDANAISPDTARSISGSFEHYVDGSVVGPPAHNAGTTRLYLSGERAPEVAELYAGSALDARVIGAEPGAASALKMAYASWTKIGSAMHLAIRALAQSEGVEAALVDEWNISQPGMVERSDLIARGVSPKAWRFTGEMEQIAAAFSGAGLPDGFAQAAHDVYSRMADFKGGADITLDQVLAALNIDGRPRPSGG